MIYILNVTINVVMVDIMLWIKVGVVPEVRSGLSPSFQHRRQEARKVPRDCTQIPRDTVLSVRPGRELSPHTPGDRK